MTEIGKKLKTVLEGYATFLRKRELVLPKHQQHLVRWVRDFLLFAEEHGGYTFEQTLDLFLAAVGERVGIKPWQIQQAADAVRIYRYQYRGSDSHGQSRPASGSAFMNDDESLLSRLREVIRLRHYARRTEKTYLHWARRFLAYRSAL